MGLEKHRGGRSLYTINFAVLLWIGLAISAAGTESSSGLGESEGPPDAPLSTTTTTGGVGGSSRHLLDEGLKVVMRDDEIGECTKGKRIWLLGSNKTLLWYHTLAHHVEESTVIESSGLYKVKHVPRHHHDPKNHFGVHGHTLTCKAMCFTGSYSTDYESREQCGNGTAASFSQVFAEGRMRPPPSPPRRGQRPRPPPCRCGCEALFEHPGGESEPTVLRMIWQEELYDRGMEEFLMRSRNSGALPDVLFQQSGLMEVVQDVESQLPYRAGLKEDAQKLAALYASITVTPPPPPPHRTVARPRPPPPPPPPLSPGGVEAESANAFLFGKRSLGELSRRDHVEDVFFAMLHPPCEMRSDVNMTARRWELLKHKLVETSYVLSSILFDNPKVKVVETVKLMSDDSACNLQTDENSADGTVRSWAPAILGGVRSEAAWGEAAPGAARAPGAPKIASAPGWGRKLLGRKRAKAPHVGPHWGSVKLPPTPPPPPPPPPTIPMAPDAIFKPPAPPLHMDTLLPGQFSRWLDAACGRAEAQAAEHEKEEHTIHHHSKKELEDLRAKIRQEIVDKHVARDEERLG